MSAPAPAWQAWLDIECGNPRCPEVRHRIDLVLVRGFDLAGGPQIWHAMAPVEYDGTPLAGRIGTETAGDIPPNVYIDWPVRIEEDGPVLHGATALRHSMS